MAAVRESWTDHRLDDLNYRVDELGRRMDAGFIEVSAEMNARFDSVDTKFDALQRTMIQVGGGIIATLLASFAGVIATQL